MVQEILLINVILKLLANHVKQTKANILEIILRNIMIQRRGLTEPLYKTIDYIHYIDFGLQLRPNDCNFLIRRGFISL